MCEPTTILMATSLAMTAVGGITQARAQSAAGQAQADAAKYQAQVAKNNSIMAERAAQDALARGAAAEAQQRARGRLVMGSQKTKFAANGIDLASETVEDVAASQGGLNELDALTVRENAAREAYGFRVEGSNYSSQADLLRSQAQGYKAAGQGAAVGTLLSTGGAVAGQWYSMGSPNPFASKTSSAGLDSVKWGTKSSVWNRGY
jgi:hypothetical protein